MKWITLLTTLLLTTTAHCYTIENKTSYPVDISIGMVTTVETIHDIHLEPFETRNAPEIAAHDASLFYYYIVIRPKSGWASYNTEKILKGATDILDPHLTITESTQPLRMCPHHHKFFEDGQTVFNVQISA